MRQLLFWLCLLYPAGLAGTIEDAADLARRHAAAARWKQALEVAEKALAAAPRDPRLLEVKGRCLFELGDYPASEGALKATLEASGGSLPDAERALLLARLAEVILFQGANDEAVAQIEKALELTAAPVVRRIAVSVFLRAQRFEDVLSHADALLDLRPEDSSLRFARGLARSRLGRFRPAIDDLEVSARTPALWRDARFELALARAKLGQPREALARLREILENDPHDGEALYQTARQLLTLRRREANRMAAHLTRYFESLRSLEGQSSREQHLRAAGDRDAARIEAAGRWERVGAYEKVLESLEDPSGRTGRASLYLAGFWLRRGLLEEAEKTAKAAEPVVAASGATAREAVAALLETASAARAEIAARKPSRSSAARARLASVRWDEALPALEECLRAAALDRDAAAAREAARLLLARDPTSRMALRHLVAGAGEPSLIVPRLHYLSRLAAQAPADATIRSRLEQARRMVEAHVP